MRVPGVCPHCCQAPGNVECIALLQHVTRMVSNTLTCVRAGDVQRPDDPDMVAAAQECSPAKVGGAHTAARLLFELAYSMPETSCPHAMPMGPIVTYPTYLGITQSGAYIPNS